MSAHVAPGDIILCNEFPNYKQLIDASISQANIEPPFEGPKI